MFQLRTEISVAETSGGGEGGEGGEVGEGGEGGEVGEVGEVGEGGEVGVSGSTTLKFVGAGSVDCPTAVTDWRRSHPHINPRLVTGRFTM